MADTVLLDLDDTVFDFSACEKAAFLRCLESFGIVPSDEYASAYHIINDGFWRMLERKEITRAELRIKRFEEFFKKYSMDIPAPDFACGYENALSEECVFLPGAMETIKELSKSYRLFAATNGYIKTQTNRFEKSGIKPFFGGIFISQEIGFDKPSKEYFNAVFAGIPDFCREKTVMVGDILASDIKGGNDAGIKTVWVNRKNSENRSGIIPFAEIHSISELPDILRRI